MARFRTARYAEDAVIQYRVAAAEIFLKDALRIAGSNKRLRDASEDVRQIQKALGACSNVRLMVPVWASKGEERAITAEEYNQRCLRESEGAQDCIRKIVENLDKTQEDYRRQLSEGLRVLYEVTVLMELDDSIGRRCFESLVALRNHLRRLLSLMSYQPLSEMRRKRVRESLLGVLSHIGRRKNQESSRMSREEIREEFTKKVKQRSKMKKEKPVHVWIPEK